MTFSSEVPRELVFFGTMTIGLAHLDILLVITPARSRDSISLCTHS